MSRVLATEIDVHQTRNFLILRRIPAIFDALNERRSAIANIDERAANLAIRFRVTPHLARDGPASREVRCCFFAAS
jgi:hypothetical protein